VKQTSRYLFPVRLSAPGSRDCWAAAEGAKIDPASMKKNRSWGNFLVRTAKVTTRSVTYEIPSDRHTGKP